MISVCKLLVWAWSMCLCGHGVCVCVGMEYVLVRVCVFSGLIVIGAVNIMRNKQSGPLYTVVQLWLLAIDRDRIAVGLSFKSPSI